MASLEQPTVKSKCHHFLIIIITDIIGRCHFDFWYTIASDENVVICVSVNVSGIVRAESRFAPSQWETALLCNDVSHWLGASLESALIVTESNSYISRDHSNTPSHYLNQCWFIISRVHWHSHEIPNPSITKIVPNITYLKFLSNLPGANGIKSRLGVKCVYVFDSFQTTYLYYIDIREYLHLYLTENSVFVFWGKSAFDPSLD